jgi:hypothetical protein
LGSDHVYFQPPEGAKMKYPAIAFFLDSVDEKRADNCLYNNTNAYLVTVIDQNPDSSIPGKIAQLPMCSFVRRYTAAYLNHTVYKLYY